METNLSIDTLENQDYRKVIFTVPKSFQLVLMSLLPQEEIGMERHPHTSQFIKVEKGIGIAVIGKTHYALGTGSAVVIPPGVKHNIINVSSRERLQLYTVYTPPEHSPGTREKYHG